MAATRSTAQPDSRVSNPHRAASTLRAPAPTIAKTDRDDSLLLLVLRLVMTGTIELADDALLDRGFLTLHVTHDRRVSAATSQMLTRI